MSWPKWRDKFSLSLSPFVSLFLGLSGFFQKKWIWLNQPGWVHELALDREGNVTVTWTLGKLTEPPLAPPLSSHWWPCQPTPSSHRNKLGGVWTGNMALILLIGHSHSGCGIFSLTHWGWTPFLNFSLGWFSVLRHLTRDPSCHSELYLPSFQKENENQSYN